MNLNQAASDGRFNQLNQGGQGQSGYLGSLALHGGGAGAGGGGGGPSGMTNMTNTMTNIPQNFGIPQTNHVGLNVNVRGGTPGLATALQTASSQGSTFGSGGGGGGHRMGGPLVVQQGGMQQQFAGNQNLTQQYATGSRMNGFSTNLRLNAGSLGVAGGGVTNPGAQAGALGPLPPGQGMMGRPGINMVPHQQLSHQQQRSFPGGGSLGGANRGVVGLGTLGGVSGGFTAPSGDLLSMLSMNKSMSNQRQEPETPAFNASDFPSLGAATQPTQPAQPIQLAQPGQPPAAQYRHSSQDSSIGASNETFATLLHHAPKQAPQTQQGGLAFGEEDFPALPGSSARDARQLQQQQQQQQEAPSRQAPSSMPVSRVAAAGQVQSGQDPYGLLGLLNIIHMTDPDTTTLALGTDLTTLGLNLNSSEALWKTFASPWADGPGRPEPEFRLPACYLSIPVPRLTQAYFSRFQPDTLFYIFYGMPGDEAQVYAADELANRGWYYHKELRAWLTRVPGTEALLKTDRFERGSFYLFDPSTWDVVRRDNFQVSFDALERPPGLVKPASLGSALNPQASGLPPPHSVALQNAVGGFTG